LTRACGKGCPSRSRAFGKGCPFAKALRLRLARNAGRLPELAT
jgi:hypothetical protein